VILFPVPIGLKPKKGRQLSLSSRINLLSFALAFGVMRQFRPAVPEPVQLKPSSRVLFFSTGGIGDSLLDSAAINALAAAYPGIEITVVVHHKRQVVMQHNPWVRKVIEFSKGPIAFHLLQHALRKSGRWDAIFYLTAHDPESRCLGYLVAPGRTFGLAWRSEFYGLASREIDQPGLRRAHLAEQARAVVEAAGVQKGEPRMDYRVSEKEVRELENWANTNRAAPLPRIIFQLGGGGQPFRDWPVPHFVKLLDLIEEGNLGPVGILGGPDHRAKAARFAQLAGGLPFTDFVGKLPLPLSAALLSHAECLVSTDTGIMHLGFALRTPTVALLHCSPGRSRVGPLVDLERHQVLELAKPSNYGRPEDASMAEIAPEDVFEKVREVLHR